MILLPLSSLPIYQYLLKHLVQVNQCARPPEYNIYLSNVIYNNLDCSKYDNIWISSDSVVVVSSSGSWSRGARSLRTAVPWYCVCVTRVKQHHFRSNRSADKSLHNSHYRMYTAATRFRYQCGLKGESETSRTKRTGSETFYEVYACSIPTACFPSSRPRTIWKQELCRRGYFFFLNF